MCHINIILILTMIIIYYRLNSDESYTLEIIYLYIGRYLYQISILLFRRIH